MKVEQERGISVTASVMTFDYAGCTFNLLDTPGHQDFSEDTYRTLTAVDSAVMVIDAAKGIETQTRKLFEVCRLRNVPIITFVNKMDRDGRDPFELMDEIERDLQLHVTPANWPIGMGKEFHGCYDLLKDRADPVRPRQGLEADGGARPSTAWPIRSSTCTCRTGTVERAARRGAPRLLAVRRSSTSRPIAKDI